MTHVVEALHREHEKLSGLIEIDELMEEIEQLQPTSNEFIEALERLESRRSVT